MRKLLSRSEAIEHYRAAQPRADASALATLPPLLCHHIVTDSWASSNTIDELPGAPSSVVGLPADLWGKLPLQGLRPSTEPKFLHEALQLSLRRFGSLWPSRLAYIRDWITSVQWVEQDSERPGALLTSSTFPALPHCAFMSAKARRHIPPNIVLDTDSEYALFENLFHEALHQQLSTTVLFCDSVHSDYASSNCIKIPVPWRGNAWEPDRVLHATFVYCELLALRRDAEEALIELAPRFDLKSACYEANNALTYLTDQFHLVRPAFTEEGQDILDAVLLSAQAALGKAPSSQSPRDAA